MSVTARVGREVDHARRVGDGRGFLAPDCPNAGAAVAAALRRLGRDIPLHERTGEYASPTVLVNGIDVVTGATGAGPAQACRLDLPTETHIVTALDRADQASTPTPIT